MPDPSFLIDECLSPDLAQIALGRGFHALHVNWANLTRKTDRQVSKYALDHDMILVTNNTIDFEKIYKNKEIHPGLIFIEYASNDVMDGECQVHAFEAALDEVEEEEPINEAILVVLRLNDEDEDEIVLDLERYDLPELMT